MTMGTDATKNCELLFEYMRGILYDSWIEHFDVGALAEPYKDLGRGLQYMQNAVNELVTYSAELSKGNLSVEFPVRESEESSCEPEPSYVAGATGDKGRLFSARSFSGRILGCV